MALASYVFISQSIEKKRVQRQRALMTLQTKRRNFMHMISGFPPGFLTSDLLGLVYRALIDTCEQLRVLEPKSPQHQDDVTLFTNQLAALPKNAAAQRVRMDNPQQMKDVRQNLQELQRFVIQQEAIRVINKVQADSYVDQIKRVNLQMGVDSYIYLAKQAQQIGKLKLALHYFGLARKLLVGENTGRAYDKQIGQLDVLISKLEEQTQTHKEPEAAEPDPAASQKEWDSFNPEDSWKKKQMYD
jgi:hypothetical protein